MRWIGKYVFIVFHITNIWTLELIIIIKLYYTTTFRYTRCFFFAHSFIAFFSSSNYIQVKFTSMWLGHCLVISYRSTWVGVMGDFVSLHYKEIWKRQYMFSSLLKILCFLVLNHPNCNEGLKNKFGEITREWEFDFLHISKGYSTKLIFSMLARDIPPS